MKCIILYILLFDIICTVFSNNDAYNCSESRNLFIVVEDLPSLLKNFTICFVKCHQSKIKDCLIIASQLKSSISVLRELYYHGQIGLWVCITFLVFTTFFCYLFMSFT